MMQRTFSAVCRTTNRLAWLGSRSYSYETDGEYDSNIEKKDYFNEYSSNERELYEKSVNRVTLLGRVGKDPYINTDNYTFAYFPLATAISYIQKETDARKQVTTWHDIKVNRPQTVAKLKNIGKGSRLYIEGMLINRSFTNREGNQQFKTSVLAETLIIVSGKEREGAD